MVLLTVEAQDSRTVADDGVPYSRHAVRESRARAEVVLVGGESPHGRSVQAGDGRQARRSRDWIDRVGVE